MKCVYIANFKNHIIEESYFKNFIKEYFKDESVVVFDEIKHIENQIMTDYLHYGINNYDKKRIEQLEYIEKLYKTQNTPDIMFNSIVSYLAYDLYRTINSFNYISDTFTISNTIYINLALAQCNTLNDLFDMFILSDELKNTYIRLFNTPNLFQADLYILLTKNLYFEKPYLVFIMYILKHILHINFEVRFNNRFFIC